MTSKFIVLIFVISIVLSLQAQKTDTLPNLYLQLLNEGWNRKEVDRLSQTYIQENSNIRSRKDKTGRPLPVPNGQLLENLSQIHNWADQYREEYKKFEAVFPESKKHQT